MKRLFVLFVESYIHFMTLVFLKGMLDQRPLKKYMKLPELALCCSNMAIFYELSKD